MRKGRSWRRNCGHAEQSRELIRFLFQRAANFKQMLSGGRFWRARSRAIRGTPGGQENSASTPNSLQLFIDNYATLKEVFGEPDLLANLGRASGSGDCAHWSEGPNGGRVPWRLRRTSTKRRGEGSSRGRAGKGRSVRVKEVGRRGRDRRARKHRRQQRKDIGGVRAGCGLSCDPPIFLTGMAYEETDRNCAGVRKGIWRSAGGIPDLSVLDDRSDSASARVIETAEDAPNAFSGT